MNYEANVSYQSKPFIIQKLEVNLIRFLFFLAAILLILSFIPPAYAKITIGGRVFVDCYFLERDRANTLWKKLGDTPFTNTAIQVPNITRLNVKWTNEENVGMFIQLGLGQKSGGTVESQSDGVTLRHAYGWCNLTRNFQIMAGKTTSPISPLLPFQMVGTRSGSLNIIGEGYGELYSGRFAQIRGTYHFTNRIRLAVALVDPNGRSLGQYAPYHQEGISYRTNTKLPRIDVGLPIYAGPVDIYPSFLYQRRSVDFFPDQPITAGIDNHIDTYIASVGVMAALGPVKLSAELNWGQNWGNTRTGMGVSPPARNSGATLYQGQLDNTQTYGWWIDAAYEFTSIIPHVMYGQMRSQGDKNPMWYKSWFWGISIPMDLAKGFRLIPEVMWYDDGDDNRNDSGKKLDYGKYAIYGLQLQFRF
jgi:hypothetical protein